MPAKLSEQGSAGSGAHRRRWPRALLLPPLAVLLLGAGCVTMTKHDWLCFFFDGVPGAPGTPSAQKPAPEVDSEGYPVVLRPVQPPGRAPKIYQHAPYADNTCTDCHESKFSQRLKKKSKELCFTCHDDFLAKAKVKHAPAEAGECLSCHNPHQSEQKALLTRKGKALCLECHEDASTGKVKHAPVADGECLACHAPHQSEQKFLLRELMRGKLPEAVLTRGKTGFDIPTHDWFRGPLRALLMDTVTPAAVEATGIFDAQAVESLIRDHMERRINAGYHLWGLLTLFLWMKRWKVEAPREMAAAPQANARVFATR